jgi:UDP-glucose 4-epimerase
MKSKNKERVIVTGGAGFIGTQLAISLARDYQIVVIDDLSLAMDSNVKQLLNHGIEIKKQSLQSTLSSKPFKNCSTVFHLAGKSNVKESMLKPQDYFENNVHVTMNLLESMRKQDVKKIVFTSSSVVYGETKKTVNEQSLTKPISIYGVTKLLCESLIESYCNIYGFKGVILRLANIIGENSTKGLIHDMMLKFKKNPKQIIILGDGKQVKSYLHVNDCVTAIITGHNNMKKQKSNIEVFNVSGKDFLDVNTIVKTIGETLGYDSFKSIYQKYDESGRGWSGDIIQSKMNISKLEKLDWKPMSSINSIKSIVREINTN